MPSSTLGYYQLGVGEMKYKSVKGLLTNDESLIPVTFIDKLEDILHGFLGIMLFIISILAAGYTLQRLVQTRPFFPLGMIQAINDTLFVVIILEIMRTMSDWPDSYF